MAYHSSSSKDYVPVINNLNKPGYTSTYGNQISNKLNQILTNPSFTYDVEKDPNFQKYKQNYVELGEDAVQNAVASNAGLTGGYGQSYSAKAAAQANQQYITRMTERIPELMNAAMQKYQMEQDEAYKQFGALQTEENRLYGQHRDTVGDYYKDLNALTTGYNQAKEQENNQRAFDYQQSRDEVSDSHWNKNFEYQKTRDAAADDKWSKKFDYQKERDAVADVQWREKFDFDKSRDNVSDARTAAELEYKKQKDAISDDQWQKEFDLKQLEYENALKKAKSSGSGRSGRSGRYSYSDVEPTFFKMKGTANMKTYSGNKVDTSRNATLSVTKRNELMNQLLSTGSISEARKLLNQWGYDGQISEGDWDYLEDLYKKATAAGINQFTVKKSNTKKRG